MSETLCAIDPCYLKGRHTSDGCDADCTGCLPGLAADGLLICSWHHRRAIQDLRQMPGLDADLGKALVPITSGVKPWSAVVRSPGINLDQNVIDARDYLRSALANLAGYVVVERGLHLPPAGNVPDMTAFLTRHADWMSANPVLAPIWGRQVANVRQEARRRAYRARPTMKLGDCPLTKDDGSVCGGIIRHDPSDYAGQNVTCPTCGTTGTVDWWQATIFGDQGALLSDAAVARLLSSRYARVVSPATIRAWASKGIIGAGKDGQGRTVYDLAVVRAHADTIWDPVPTGKTA